MDEQGRLLFPQLLRDSAKVVGDAVVLGSQTMLEVVNHEAFKAELEAQPLSETDMATLADLGL